MRNGVIIYNARPGHARPITKGRKNSFGSAEGVKGGAACKAKVEKKQSRRQRKKTHTQFLRVWVVCRMDHDTE